MRPVVLATILFALLGLVLVSPAAAEETSWSAWTKNKLEWKSADGDFSMRFTLLGQGLYTFKDPEGGDSSNDFRVRRVRPGFRGKLFGKVGYRVQYELAGSPNLLDFYLNWGSSAGKLQVGQFKAPFGRQELTSIAKQQFVDRSIASKRFAPSRQIGLAVLGKSSSSKFEYGLGVFNGNGRNKSADDNDDKMIAGRAVFNFTGAYALDETPLDYPDSAKFSLGFSGMTNTEGSGSGETDVNRFGTEFAFKVAGFSMIGEYYQETADPVFGSDLDTDGYYFQAGYLFPNRKMEVALRYAVISPDVAGFSQDQTETGVSMNFFIAKHGHQVQLDFRELEFDADPSKDRTEFRTQVQIAF